MVGIQQRFMQVLYLISRDFRTSFTSNLRHLAWKLPTYLGTHTIKSGLSPAGANVHVGTQTIRHINVAHYLCHGRNIYCFPRDVLFPSKGNSNVEIYFILNALSLKSNVSLGLNNRRKPTTTRSPSGRFSLGKFMTNPACVDGFCAHNVHCPLKTHQRF